jgi:hypothetical protein
MKNKKIFYKIKNWKDYNKALINRGNITIWFNKKTLKNWYASPKDKKRGRPFIYSDICIELALTIKYLFHMPLRGTQGFIQSMFDLLNYDLDVPHYSRLSRRAADLEIDLSSVRNNSEAIHLLIDSTGLKIYGEGEWKMKIHGKGKRRTWRKLHVAIDSKSNQCISMELTKANINDSKVLPDLVKDQENVEDIYADGAYPFKACLDAIAEIGANAFIPVRDGTTLSKDPSPGLEIRNRIIKETWAAGGREQWKKTSGYHLRSLVETYMFRFKTILGSKLSAREFENQVVEARVKTSILNKMSQLGMPITEAIKPS